MSLLTASMLDALEDKRLLGGLACFEDRSTWRSWIVFEKARLGLPLDADELVVFRRHTEREAPRPGGYPVALAVTGRQCGKTRWLATGAAFAAATAGPKAAGTFVSLVAQDLRGAQRAALSYVKEVFALPVFRQEVVRETQGTVELRSGVTVAVYPCRPSATRGVRNLSAFMDEAAHFISTEGRATDVEMYRALMPTLLTTAGRLVIATSPYAMTGLVSDIYVKHWGRDDSDVLVWQADSHSMNPGLDLAALQRMRDEDPDGAESEVEGRFRRGISMLLDPEAIAACVARGTRERAPERGRDYVAFADAASGSGKDSFAVSIAHRDVEAVLDVVRAWKPPFNPSGVIAEAADLLRRYGLREVTGDRYAPGFVSEGFRANGITYRPSERSKSELFLELVPAINAERAVLLDDSQLLRELRGLERRRGSSGRDRVEKRAGSHDDVANAAAGALVLAGEWESDEGTIEVMWG